MAFVTFNGFIFFCPDLIITESLAVLTDRKSKRLGQRASNFTAIGTGWVEEKAGPIIQS
jgi:hypothetical protein